MPLHWSLRAVSVLALVSLTCACGGGGGGGSPPAAPGPPGPPAANWYVSATTGSDGGAGDVGSPFRTITYACTQASIGQSIYVYPGTYDTAIGETFPIVVPPGVTVFGDEANKGAGATPTTISGGGLVPAPNANVNAFAAVVPGAGATVAGFRIVNDSTPPTLDEAVHVQAANVTLRNNRMVDSQYGIICKGGFGNQVITGNVIQNNLAIGLLFAESSGIGCRVENNVITLNGIGVDFDTAGGDLGGGAAASAGGNVISCNNEDLRTNAVTTINAANNLWDHAPPSGNDINNFGGAATIITTGATVATGACP